MPPKTIKKKKSDQQALRDVKKEMAKPRLAKSARAADHAGLIERNPSEQSSRKLSAPPFLPTTQNPSARSHLLGRI
jgi:hypothetical protein